MADKEQDRDDDPELDMEINFAVTAMDEADLSNGLYPKADEESKTVGQQGFPK